MPMVWTKPAVFLKYKGKTIYHAYKDGHISNVMAYWYNTDPFENDTDCVFDIRNLGVGEVEDFRSREDHKAVLRAAIDMGLLRFPKED